MKVFKVVFTILGTAAAIAIAFGAYWHIFSLGACALMVYTIKKEQNN